MRVSTQIDGREEAFVKEHFFSLDGFRMRYLHAGSGPPLVLVHGLMGYSFSWRNVISKLATQSEVFAVDLLGTGFSDRPGGIDQSMAGCAGRLLRFVEALCHGPIDLLGTSHGGAIAMRMAELAPDRVKRLILVAPANPWAPRGKRLAPFLSNALISPLALRIVPLMREYYFRRLFGDTRRILPGTLEGYSKPLALAGSYEYAFSILRTWNHDLNELRSLLPRIAEIPTLLVWGNRDGAVAPESAEPLKQNFRNCRLVMMDGVGHLPYEEVPDEFNRLISEFLVSGNS